MPKGALPLLFMLGIGAADAADRAPRTTPPVAVLVAGEKRAPDLEVVTTQVFEGANRLRRRHGWEALASSPELTRAAQAFAAFMAETERYGHDADGDPTERAQRAGYAPCIVAENLAYQYLSTGFRTEELSEGLLEGWMDSPGHRENLLFADVTDTGVGIARSRTSGKYYAVQMFGRPLALQVSFSIRNGSGAAVTYAIDGEASPLPPGSTATHRQCRPATLAFDWPGGQEPLTLTVQSGLRYDVTHTPQGEFRVTSEVTERKR